MKSLPLQKKDFSSYIKKNQLIFTSSDSWLLKAFGYLMATVLIITYVVLFVYFVFSNHGLLNYLVSENKFGNTGDIFIFMILCLIYLNLFAKLLAWLAHLLSFPFLWKEKDGILQKEHNKLTQNLQVADKQILQIKMELLGMKMFVENNENLALRRVASAWNMDDHDLAKNDHKSHLSKKLNRLKDEVVPIKVRLTQVEKMMNITLTEDDISLRNTIGTI